MVNPPTAPAAPAVLSRIKAAGRRLARSYPALASPFHHALAQWRRKGLPPLLAELRLRLPGGQTAASGGSLAVEIFLLGLLATGNGEISLALYDEAGTLIHETLISRLGAPPLRLRFGEVRRFVVELQLPLAPGRYRLRAGFHPENAAAERPTVYAGAAFKVTAPPAERRFHGLVDLQPRLAESSADASTASETRRWESLVPARLEIGAPENPFLLGGFYTPEESPGGPFRWTTETASFQLRLAGPKILMHYLGRKPDAAGRSVTVTAQAEGLDLGTCKLKEPYGTMKFDCPEPLRGQIAVVRLAIQDCWRPSEMGVNPSDHRLLGIALAAVEAAGDAPAK